MSIIFLFVDGIGLAPDGPANVLARFRGPGAEALTGGHFLQGSDAIIKEEEQLFLPVDATLGVPGLPQSGTGQAALFSGENAPQQLGKHFGPWPHTGIKPMMRERSIFHQLLARGAEPAFMNAYPPVFFERMQRSNRWSCSTLMTRSSKLQLRSTKDILAGKALSAEIFGDYWRSKLGIALPQRNGRQVADVLLSAAEEHALVMFEYYLTDKAGHARKPDYATEVLERLDKLLYALVKYRGRHTLVLCSDHGNLEDLSTKSHTRNPVPLLVTGPLTPYFHTAENIMDVAHALVEAASTSQVSNR